MNIITKKFPIFSFISKAFTWCFYLILTILVNIFQQITLCKKFKNYIDNMAYHFLPRLSLLGSNTEISTINYNTRHELNCNTDSESKKEVCHMSKKYFKENVAEAERSHVIKSIKYLKGYTGKIKCYNSANEGILEFKVKKFVFNSHIVKDRVVDCSKLNQSLCELLPPGTVIYFDAKWNNKLDSYKVIQLWSGSKAESRQSIKKKSDELHPRKVYKAVVTQVNKHSFTATVTNNLKTFTVFVEGNVYHPSFTSSCLKKGEQVSLFVTVGDEVLMHVQKITENCFTQRWCAVKAWKQKVQGKPLRHKVCEDNFKIGTVTDVSEVEGSLLYDGLHFQFYNFSSHLFGVNLDGINLNHIFQEGDKVRFIPGSDTLIAQIWHGDIEIVDEDVSLSFTKFCLLRRVPYSTVTKLTMQLDELKKQNAESFVSVHNNSEPKKLQSRKKKCSVIKDNEEDNKGLKDLSNPVLPDECSNICLMESDTTNLQVHEQNSIMPQYTDRATQTISTGEVLPLTTQVLQGLLHMDK